MLEHYPLIVLVSVVSSLIVAGATGWWRARREDVARRREHFASAFAATVEYCEFPFVIRRRGINDPEGERLRISTELREVQKQIAFYQAWLRTESDCVADAYERLVREIRMVAGGQMHDAWKREPISSDEEVNVSDITSGEISELQEAYLDAVRRQCSWWRRSKKRHRGGAA